MQDLPGNSELMEQYNMSSQQGQNQDVIISRGCVCNKNCTEEHDEIYNK